MMALRVIIPCLSLLLVCLSKAEVTGSQRIRRTGGGRHKCLYKYQPINCVNNPRMRITKNDHYYFINITLLKSDIHVHVQWIECNHICRGCNNLLSQTGQGKNVKQVVHVHLTMVIAAIFT